MYSWFSPQALAVLAARGSKPALQINLFNFIGIFYLTKVSTLRTSTRSSVICFNNTVFSLQWIPDIEAIQEEKSKVEHLTGWLLLSRVFDRPSPLFSQKFLLCKLLFLTYHFNFFSL